MVRTDNATRPWPGHGRARAVVATLLVLALTAAVTALQGGVAAAATFEGRIVLDQGHTDAVHVGPDGVSLFTTDAGGEPTILVDSEDSLPDSVVLPVGTHAHQNWAFEAPGRYFLVVDATATLAATGQPVTSTPTVLTFRVKP